MTATAGQRGPSGGVTNPGMVKFRRLQSGGRFGPNGEVRNEVICGQLWTDQWVIGTADGEFQMTVPDIRMAPNQLWPQHWHDEWIAVVVLDGMVMIGDWWMKRGDIMISPEDVEYGPLLVGPSGCQLLETFSRSRAGGGYGEEFRGHPTLSCIERVMFTAAPEMWDMACGDYVRKGSPFGARPPGSEHNAGKAVIPIDSVKGLQTGSLTGNGVWWDLGEPNDPLRGVLLDTGYAAGQDVPPHRHRDARWILVMEGSMCVGDREVTRDDILLIERDVEVPAFIPGADGVQLLEFIRTVAGLPILVDEQWRADPDYKNSLDLLQDIEFESSR